MSSNREPGVGRKHSTNPEVEGTYRHHERIQRNADPAYADHIYEPLIGEKLKEFVDHDNGFLKVRRALDSSDLHLTWTWSVGPFAARYVYVRVFAWQMGYGLTMLLEKLTEVEAGERLSTPDKLGHRSE